MRNLHKLILSVLVLTVILSLTACRKKPVEPTEPATTEEVTTEAPTEEVTTEAPTTEPPEEVGSGSKSGTSVWGIQDIIFLARENLDKESIKIRITNPKMLKSDVKYALQQVGGGYLICELNEDATEIIIRPADGMTKKEALARLEEMDKLADKIYAECVTEDMSDLEAAEELYLYLANKVSDETLSVFGSYAQALQMLFRKAGATCLVVNGTVDGELHTWNLAYVDGDWGYFDAAVDMGHTVKEFEVFHVTEEKMQNYTWDKDMMKRITDNIVSGWGK